MQKLDIHDTAGLTRHAIAAGIIESSVQLTIGLLDLPHCSVFVVVVIVDAEKGLGFTDCLFVRRRIQTHPVLLAPGIVVFETESAALLIEDSGYFHPFMLSEMDCLLGAWPD